MYFSEAFALEIEESDDWFDSLLEVDTQLFVDPFLMYAESDGFWSDSGERLAEHFQRSFEILAGHQANPRSIQYRKVLDLMLFPEPEEFGLGYVSRGTDGSGTGRGFARRIVKSMAIAIERGLQDLHHFEELGLLVEKINRDRISDIACNILKFKFIQYTQEVCARHGVPMQEFEVVHAGFDPIRKRWIRQKVNLPKNPITGKHLLLTPKRFLRELPTLNADDWWMYVEPEFRDDINLDLHSRLRKADIINLAQQNPEKVREWSTARENSAPEPYDIDTDPVGLHNWQRITAGISSEHPIDTDVVTPETLGAFIRQVNDSFRHFIEEQGGWRLLRNDDTGLPKRETSIQLLYKGVVQSYCKAHGVRLDREVELGRGPVDFVFSNSTERVLMEVKKMRNGSYWDGLTQQLVSYLRSDETQQGWFLAVRLTDSKKEIARTAQLSAHTRQARIDSGFDINSAWIDARPHLSASLLDGTGDGTHASGVIDPEFPDNE